MKLLLNKIIFLLAMLFSLSAKSQSIEDPLDGYLRIAAENNLELKATFNQYLSVLERMPQAKALPDPNVMFNIFASPVETRVGAQQAGISISQAFPWFGQLKDKEAAVSEIAKAKFELFEETKNKLVFEVSTAYYELYALEAAIRITENNITLLESFREMANIRLEANNGSAVDFLRAEIEIDKLKNQFLYLQDSKLPIQTKFKELLNTESVTKIVIPDTLKTTNFIQSKQLLLDSILTQNPQLKTFDHRIQSLDFEVDVARKAGLPSFSLGMSYTNIERRTDVDVPNNGKDALILPQVGIKIPLYRNKYKAMVKEKELLKSAVSFEKENRENELETLLEESWRDYIDANRRIELNKRLVGYAQQSLDLLVTEYTAAGTNFEEILRMEGQLLDFELELEKALAEQNTFVAFINYLTGKSI